MNTSQQIGGSIGTALLNTIAVSVTTRALRAHSSTLATLKNEFAAATLHGYAVAFWWAAGFFGVGAVLSFALLESGASDPEVDLVAR